MAVARRDHIVDHGSSRGMTPLRINAPPGGSLGHAGRQSGHRHVRSVLRPERAGQGPGRGDARGHHGRVRGGESRRRHPWPAVAPHHPRRPLRARGGHRQHQPAHRRGSGYFALIGAVGTPTSKAAEPIATEAGVPYVGAFTGAEFLRDARKRPTVINVRASYYQETEEMVERLTRDLGVKRIGILYQDDSYGRAGLSGTLQALHRRGMTLVAEATYPRNTQAVKIRGAGPQARRPGGGHHRRRLPARGDLHQVVPLPGLQPHLREHLLRRQLGAGQGRWAPAGKGVIVTQVVPFPHDRWIPVVARYHEALRAVAANAEPGFVSLEGYLTGARGRGGVAAGGSAPPRAKGSSPPFRRPAPWISAAFMLLYGEADNQGSDRVYLTVIDDSRAVSLDPAPGATVESGGASSSGSRAGGSASVSRCTPRSACGSGADACGKRGGPGGVPGREQLSSATSPSRSVPSLVAAIRAAQQSSALVDAAPRLVSATSEAELNRGEDGHRQGQGSSSTS